MDRKRYLEMCSAVAQIPAKSQGIKTVPKRLQVRYQESYYYPEAYVMYFAPDGSPLHYGILHDLNAKSSIMYAKLESICEV